MNHKEESDVKYIFILTVVFIILVAVGTYFDQKETQKLRKEYKYQVHDDYGHIRGYTNSEPNGGCVYIESKGDILCGTFELLKF
jgi:hypothetical protein